MIEDVIADIVEAKVRLDSMRTDDAVVDAIVRVYRLHNDGCECPCDYCLAMRLAAELSRKEVPADGGF